MDKNERDYDSYKFASYREIIQSIDNTIYSDSYGEGILRKEIIEKFIK